MTVAPEAHGLRWLIEKLVDKGDPRQQERGNFADFLKKFGLPANHKLVKQALLDLKNGEEDWGLDSAEVCTQFASEVLDHTNLSNGELVREKHCNDRLAKIGAIKTVIEEVVCLDDKSPTIQRLVELERALRIHAQNLRKKEVDQHA